MMEPEKKRSDIKEPFVVAFLAILCFLIFTYLLAVAVGPFLFFYTSDGLVTSMKSINVNLWLFAVPVDTPVELRAGEVFLFLTAIFLLCFYGAWKQGASFHKVIRKGSSLSFSAYFSNFLAAMPIIASMLFTAVLAIIISQTIVGIPTTPPSGTESLPAFDQLFSVSYASLIEEIGFRISPIGLFILLYVDIVRESNKIKLSDGERIKLFFTSLLIPDKAKKMAGLKSVSEFGIRRGISRGEWAMILLTAITFGALHFVFGWSIAKISSAAVSGVAFGLLYLVYGAYAPILLHWFFNYYTSILDYDFALKYAPYLVPIGSFGILLILAVGICGWIAFAVIGIKRLIRWKREPSPMQIEFDQAFKMEKDTG